MLNPNLTWPEFVALISCVRNMPPRVKNDHVADAGKEIADDKQKRLFDEVPNG